jgi:hypothetical protein
VEKKGKEEEECITLEEIPGAADATGEAADSESSEPTQGKKQKEEILERHQRKSGQRSIKTINQHYVHARRHV